MKGKIKTRFCMLVIIAISCIALMLYVAKETGIGLWVSKADMLQNEKKEMNVMELQTRVEKNNSIWVALIEDTAYSDLCSDVYAKRFEDIANEFNECYKEFNSLYENETTLENYRQYQEYFTVYKNIGQSLYDFSDAIRDSRYNEAIELICNLRILNSSIPIIE